MELYIIPFEDKYVIYRPLLPVAFVGNAAMVECCRALADAPENRSQLPEEALTFLENVGFLQPDRPCPAAATAADGICSATFLLTNRCNLRCVYCYAAGGEGPPRDLSVEQAQLVIDRVCQNAVAAQSPQFDISYHGGGEPLQAWQAMQAITAYARAKPIPCRISLTTNALWSAEQRAWVLANVDNLSLSFDGRQETQDAQRPLASGRGSFALAMETIRALDEAQHPYGVRMTAMPPFSPRLVEDVRFLCEATHSRVIQVEPVLNSRRQAFAAPSMSEAEDFIQAFEEAFDVAAQAGRQLVYAAARPWTVTSAFCGGPYNAAILRPDGDLVACYEVTDRAHPLADLSTLGHIADGELVWDEEARARLWASLERKRALCRGCFCYWHCAGDCYTRTRVFQSEYDPTDTPRCHVNRQLSLHMLLWYIMSSEEGAWRGLAAPAADANLLRMF